ncbi:MAG: hypothetical protein NTU44_05370 [Bacteroidetes bacterium]|nr:hypothetical protein [Bacteroidota bacterium]
MKKLVFFLLITPLSILGQHNYDAKRDYFWLLGSHYPNPMQGSTLNFNTNPVTFSYNSRTASYYITNSSICDPDGNLLFSTNGLTIFQADQQIMQNGDSLNPGSMATVSYQNLEGYGTNQAALTLPFTNNIYYVFQLKGEAFQAPPLPAFYIDYLLFSVVDMSKNDGKGEVIRKNVTLLQDSLDDLMTAVRHANGRDWWVVVSRTNSPDLITILCTPAGFTVKNNQTIGKAGIDCEFGYSCFSPDGTKFIRYSRHNIYADLRLDYFHFDRCSGLFSDYQDLSWASTDASVLGGVSVSPNSRYLYLSQEERIYQFDLEQPDIASTRQIVAQNDGFCDPVIPQNRAVFGMSLPGPDGRIYINAGQTSYMHMIENPDSMGIACGVCQHCIQLDKPDNFGIPNYPNFRLGRLEGSTCDTLQTWFGIDDPQHNNPVTLSNFPNPAIDNIRIDIGLSGNNFYIGLEIFNNLMQKVDNIIISPFQSSVYYNVAGLSGGVYFEILKTRNNTILAKGKFMVTR